MRGERGRSLAELLAALAVAALLAAAASPSLEGLRSRARMRGATAEMLSAFRSARSRAIAEARTLGLVFAREPSGWTYALHADGDGDGIRSADVAAGIDPPLTPPRRLAGTWPGVDLGTPPLARIRKLPPATGFAAPPADPVQFGASDIVSFTPAGDASSGTLYLTDARGSLSAVVLFGPTVRARSYRYDLQEEAWMP